MKKSPCKDCEKQYKLPHCAPNCEILSKVQKAACNQNSTIQEGFSNRTAFPCHVLMQGGRVKK